MSDRKHNLKTPGVQQPVQDRAKLSEQLDQEQANFEDQLLEEEGADDTALTTEVGNQKEKPAQLAPDMLALVAAEVDRRLALAAAAQKKIVTAVAPNVPTKHAHEVDAFDIRKEVLTYEGYVVPATYPEPPHLKNLQGIR